MNFISIESISEEELKRLALKECQLIVDNFNPTEINRLWDNIIDPSITDECIYGTMTGSCNSPRVFDFINTLETVIKYKDMENFNKNIRSLYYMTPLETFIYIDEEEKEAADWDEDLTYEEQYPRTTLIMETIKKIQSENN